MVLAAAAVHEAGHYLALRLLGGRVTKLRLTLFGAEMETDNHHVSYGGEVLAALAGPFANLIWAWLLVKTGDGTQPELVGANITLALFNLLPIRPLDGGRALGQLTAWVLGPTAGETVCRCGAAVFGTALAALLGYVMWCTGGSLWLLPPMAALLTAVWQEWMPPRK